MKLILTLLSISSLILINSKPVKAITTTLYDGSGLPENNSPQWLAPGAIDSSGNPIFPITPYQTITSDGVTIQTKDIDSGVSSTAGYLGYSNYTPNITDPSELQLINSEFPTLNADNGYSILFDVALNEITDSDDNRSAFSIIAISSDINKGIELDFDSDRIFAQSDTVSSGEFSEFLRLETETSASFITTTNNSYELKINSSTYELFANGDSTALLTGSLKNYEYDITATDPNLPFNPYETENFLFFGDLTDQASGEFTLGEISVDTASASVPFDFSPTLGLVLLGIGFATKKVYLRQKI